MSKFKIHMKKRLPVMTGALLIGVAIASGLSYILEAPQEQNDYLHEHLTALTVDYTKNWTSPTLRLATQDKRQIAAIIAQTDNPTPSHNLNEVMTGQALTQHLENICDIKAENCIKSVRINRALSEDHLNGDKRIANIQETSLRIDFNVTPNTENLSLKGIFNETRILSFYQTQAGWLQNRTKTISETPNLHAENERDFSAQFSKDFIGLNYYPASASWKNFWIEFPIDDIKHDLETAQHLNVNSLRIFLTHDYFNNLETQADAIEKLQRFLDLCQEKDLKVLLTFFDLRPDYTLSNWSSDIGHIDNILQASANHDALLGVDLKNQADLDFENWGAGFVEAWLTVIARHIQSKYKNLAVTTGWSKAENAARLSEIFDFVTYHEYENPKGFGQRLNNVIAKVGDKPVMITELGSTTWQPPFIQSFGESAQASRLNAQLSQSNAATGIFVWTLNDFDHVGQDVVGPLPWRRAQQRHFGLMRPDGSLRPAANILKDFGAKTLRDLTPSQTSNLTLIQDSTF